MARIQQLRAKTQQIQETEGNHEDSVLLARRGRFVLVKDEEEGIEDRFVVFTSTPEQWADGFADYGERFHGIGQAIANLILRAKRGY